MAPRLKELTEAGDRFITSKNIHLYNATDHLDYSKLQPIEAQELAEWWRKAKGTTAQKIEQVQKTWGFFPRNNELNLYGFGLKHPDEGGRPRWNPRIYSRVQTEKKGWNTNSSSQQAIFEEFLRFDQNLSPLTRNLGSQPISAAASPHLPSTSSLP